MALGLSKKFRQTLGDAAADPAQDSGLPDMSGVDQGGTVSDLPGVDPGSTMGDLVGLPGSDPGSDTESPSESPLPEAAAGPDEFSADTPNTPLAIPGTFALPGSAGSGQFRSRNFLMDRGLGGEKADYMGKRKRFGAGVPVSGSSASLGIDPEELTRRILNR